MRLVRLIIFLSCLFFCLNTWAEGLSITEVMILDQGNLSAEADFGIDLIQDSCGAADKNGDGDTNDAGDIELENFYDTAITFKVKNTSSTPLRLGKLSYRLPDSSGRLRKFMGGLYPISGSMVLAKSEAEVSYFLLKASGGKKYTFRPLLELNPNLGLQNLTLRLDIISSSGRLKRATKTVGLSFGNQDRCTSE